MRGLYLAEPHAGGRQVAPGVDRRARELMRIFVLALAALCLASCSGGQRLPAASGVANQVDPVALLSAGVIDDETYRIGATDLLSISVFQVPDLSFEEIRVDAAGNLQLPLIGSVRAAGATPGELSTEIERLLGDRYLRNPSVNVTVAQAASQKVTVDGAVTKPGVYEMRGKTTLLQAVAMAEGPTQIADLRSVAVFRVVDGQRMIAVFNLGAIRGGQLEDPVLLGDDVVVVDTSRLNARMREVIAALPGLAAFAYF